MFMYKDVYKSSLNGDLPFARQIPARGKKNATSYRISVRSSIFPEECYS
jgi:hypothetical protein